MGDYTAIADVGQTLVELLRSGMSDLITPASIVLCSPADIGASDNPRLSLFLYQVTENRYLKNQEMTVVDPVTAQYPPLMLDLYYMLTAYGSSQITDKTDRTLEEHKILGLAMRVLYDNAVLKGSVLKGGLAGTDDELRISTQPVSFEELVRPWGSFQDKSYKLSACYLVSPVIIDSSRRTDVRRTFEKDLNYQFTKKAI